MALTFDYELKPEVKPEEYTEGVDDFDEEFYMAVLREDGVILTDFDCYYGIDDCKLMHSYHKDTRCFLCNKSIPSGHQHYVLYGKSDGELFADRVHMNCFRVMDDFVRHDPDYDSEYGIDDEVFWEACQKSEYRAWATGTKISEDNWREFEIPEMLEIEWSYNWDEENFYGFYWPT